MEPNKVIQEIRRKNETMMEMKVFFLFSACLQTTLSPCPAITGLKSAESICFYNCTDGSTLVVKKFKIQTLCQRFLFV